MTVPVESKYIKERIRALNWALAACNNPDIGVYGAGPERDLCTFASLSAIRDELIQELRDREEAVRSAAGFIENEFGELDQRLIQVADEMRAEIEAMNTNKDPKQ